MPWGVVPLVRGVPFGAVPVWGAMLRGVVVRGVPFGAVAFDAPEFKLPGVPGVPGVVGVPGGADVIGAEGDA
jgi:hypothetical protein